MLKDDGRLTKRRPGTGAFSNFFIIRILSRDIQIPYLKNIGS